MDVSILLGCPAFHVVAFTSACPEFVRFGRDEAIGAFVPVRLEPVLHGLPVGFQLLRCIGQFGIVAQFFQAVAREFVQQRRVVATLE